MDKYFPPAHEAKDFHCPFCGVCTPQHWGNALFQSPPAGGAPTIAGCRICECQHCKKQSFWLEGKMIYPDSGAAPLPHDDMPSNVKADYQEARSIVVKSPRGAAALLRLAVQKLMVDLGESGNNINTDIKSLVAKGLPAQIQQALDAVRVIGNEAVHPGELNLNDSPELTHSLFELLNVIVDVMIAQPRRIAAIYGRLPADKVQAIQQRDGK